MVAPRAWRGAWDSELLYIGFGADSARVSAGRAWGCGMRAGMLCLTLCAMTLAAPAWAENRVVINPDWAEALSPELVAEHYPKIGVALEINGFAAVQCGVTREGKTRGCSIVQESPKGLGFGAAALELSALFKLKPKSVDGIPVDDGEVRIPIRFLLPAEPDIDLDSASVAPERIALAIRLANELVGGARLAGPFEKLVEEIETIPVSGVKDETRMAAASAVRSALKARKPQLRELISKTLAASLSMEELQALVTFAESAGGRSLNARSARFEPAELGSAIKIDVASDVHDRVCASMRCRPSSEESRHIDSSVPGVNIDEPVWKQNPTPEILTLASPFPAFLAGVEGRAKLICKTGPEGQLEDCDVRSEAPGGWGFGSAAVRIAKDYAVDAQSVPTGRTVALRITFPAQKSPVANEARASRPSRAHDLALGVIAAQMPIPMTPSDDQFRRIVAEKNEDGVSSQNVDAVVLAMRAATEAAYRSAREQVATRLEEQFTEPELEALAGLMSSPAGHAAPARLKAIEVATGAAASRASRILGEYARAEFCRTRDCGPPDMPH